jgi:hypothetical protein
VNEGHVIDQLAQMRQQLGNPRSTLTPLAKFPGAFHQISIHTLKGDHLLFAR